MCLASARILVYSHKNTALTSSGKPDSSLSLGNLKYLVIVRKNISAMVKRKLHVDCWSKTGHQLRTIRREVLLKTFCECDNIIT